MATGPYPRRQPAGPLLSCLRAPVAMPTPPTCAVIQFAMEPSEVQPAFAPGASAPPPPCLERCVLWRVGRVRRCAERSHLLVCVRCWWFVRVVVLCVCVLRAVWLVLCGGAFQPSLAPVPVSVVQWRPPRAHSLSPKGNPPRCHAGVWRVLAIRHVIHARNGRDDPQRHAACAWVCETGMPVSPLTPPPSPNAAFPSSRLVAAVFRLVIRLNPRGLKTGMEPKGSSPVPEGG